MSTVNNPSFNVAVAANAWGRKLDYLAYVKMCVELNAQCMPEAAYQMMCQAFDMSWETQPAAYTYPNGLIF